jgi:hypothetical protein
MRQYRKLFLPHPEDFRAGQATFSKGCETHRVLATSTANAQDPPIIVEVVAEDFTRESFRLHQQQ